jgi:gamma-glutamyltranspeptidase/glutathione hydrolase
MLVRRTAVLSLLAAALVAAPLVAGASASAGQTRSESLVTSAPLMATDRSPVAVGYGGAIATVDPDATAVGLEVLRRGGNAVDAAVAAAATLGVTEPFSSGLGGGGFFVYYDARTGKVSTLDGREAAPASMGPTAFVDPSTGAGYPFQQARVSGVSAGVPGTPLTWATALRRWGTLSWRQALAPAITVARRGFLVDGTFHDQVAGNRDAFGRFSSTSDLYLPGGQAPAPGTVFRNPDLADTYEQLARGGVEAFYQGPIADDIVRTVAHPPLSAAPIGSWTLPVMPGDMSAADLAAYQVRSPEPTHVEYHGLDVYGMATPSSGGSTVGETLNILSSLRLSGLSRTEVLHRYLEATALAFADRNRYVGDYTPRSVLDSLLDKDFAQTRACLVDPAHALAKPVAPGVPGVETEGAGCAQTTAATGETQEQHTTNLTVADRWGDVVEYTLTIEQIGGNAMVVPGRGFLLNNELTDFNFTPTQGSAPDPNLPAPGKRPRSSMSPTILLRDGHPYLAVGSPGGSTIITTVAQILLDRLDLGMSLPDAIAAPRASQRNTAAVQAEPGFLASPEAAALAAMGHVFVLNPEIGAATGVEFLGDGRVVAAAEPVRRGGGAAAVVTPAS